MKPELEKKLVKKYPNMLEDYGGDPRHTCMAWGFECGDGWFPLIEQVCEKLKDIEGFKFSQVKEKFGMLTIYYDGPRSENDRQQVSNVINEAESSSLKTCENCGQPGKICNDGGWLSTECKICKAIIDARKQLCKI